VVRQIPARFPNPPHPGPSSSGSLISSISYGHEYAIAIEKSGDRVTEPHPTGVSVSERIPKTTAQSADTRGAARAPFKICH
jgi:hypothetical protein